MRKICLFAMLLFLSACSASEEKEISLLAAASLQEPLEEIVELYEDETGNEVILQFGGSGKLAKQIEQGADANIFISADEDWIHYLDQKEILSQEDAEPFVYNTLVAIASQDIVVDASFLDRYMTAEKIAIGQPDVVPAGKYAKQVLQSMELWDNEKYVFTKDVRQALSYVTSKNVDIGFVYKTDAYISPDVQIIKEFSDEDHDPIIYPIIKIGDTSEEIDSFYDWLLSKEAMEILETYKFERNR